MGRGGGEFPCHGQPFPPDTEARLTDFAKLVAMAVANAQAQSDLTASRARVVTAADAPAGAWSGTCTTVRSSAWFRLLSRPA